MLNRKSKKLNREQLSSNVRLRRLKSALAFLKSRLKKLMSASMKSRCSGDIHTKELRGVSMSSESLRDMMRPNSDTECTTTIITTWRADPVATVMKDSMLTA